MTPELKAAEIVSAWTSKNFMDDAARPTIQNQIAEAIKAYAVEMGERTIRMVEAEEKLGRWSTEIVTDIIRSNYTPTNVGEL